MDTRIGEKFLSSGPGFGGSCFQKDILNLVYLSSFYKLEEVANYWQGVIDINNWQKSRISRLIVNYLFGNVSEKKIAILGFAFKANTNDTRESPSINICKDLLEEGAHLSIYDPKVENSKIMDDLQNDLNKIQIIKGMVLGKYASSVVGCCKNSDAIILLTEWDEFLNIDWKKLIKLMRKPAWVFDTRSCIDYKSAKKAGFNVWKIGNSPFFK